MPTSFGQRLQHAWNAFLRPEQSVYTQTLGPSSSVRLDRNAPARGIERTIVNAVYTKIATDAASMRFQHIRVDEDGRYTEEIQSDLNYCLNVEANTDQTARSFLFDIFYSVLQEGVIAVVPLEADLDPAITQSFDIKSMRTAKIVEWYPRHIRVEIYNEKTGLREQRTYPKKYVSIVENPFYSVMNEPNSTLRRLLRKLALLDEIDEESGAGKLNMIIQLPYVIRTEERKRQADARRKEIEMQLTQSKFGIAYTDGTEKIQQIGRPLENNLMEQIKYLTTTLYNQLGLSEEIFNGTADPQRLTSYHNGTIEPLVSAVTDEFNRKWISRNARTRGQRIRAFQDPFRVVPITEIANMADVFTRNEILSSNELRQIIGFKPSEDPNADALKNSNINPQMPGTETPVSEDQPMENEGQMTSDQGFDYKTMSFSDFRRISSEESGQEGQNETS